MPSSSGGIDPVVLALRHGLSRWADAGPDPPLGNAPEGQVQVGAPFASTSLQNLNSYLASNGSDMGEPSSSTLCIEHNRRGRRVYKASLLENATSFSTIEFKARPGLLGTSRPSAASAAPKHSSTHAPLVFPSESRRRRAKDILANYLLPQGFPDSVDPQYAKYMSWRAVQYFFGGALSVYTTRSLLGSLGVANRGSGEAAAAINWVVKDGAGRFGRFLFARWGRSLDGELKQFRLLGDVLMEAGAALELATALAPRAFLPLACTANLAKNLAAVTASSTRAPIYRTFARVNNLADVTAKGESVANLADIVGTAFGIALARAACPILPAFLALSAGYLYASRREVDSVVLPYLNRARLAYSMQHFAATGLAPTPADANANEACAGQAELRAALGTLRSQRHALTWRPDHGTAYVLLRDDAAPQDALRGAVEGHLLAAGWDLHHSTLNSLDNRVQMTTHVRPL
ncbi:UPF0420 protein C16orf58-like protein [Auxenochlorella protothecoides]|uniref:UPF0420 protein C16orf58-like protein n=1 Tax=Auxenochlorella protothecoides TaxID=3075 RepID=A0A087SBG4_AUXPR|nr:UPF0420 protein C16orf58-like protein [Auxenochlorella protothecoides]KFM23068.1 UPF0420 protein C16orf58-like protein [Auxenochlorella protothecoides]